MKRSATQRSRWEIIFDILQVIAEEGKKEEGKLKKTRIMQRAYLDWRNFQKHFNFLLEHGFIACADEGDHYFLTETGRDLRKRLMELEDMLANSSIRQKISGSNNSKDLYRRKF
ncbi:MAG: hypothetical protein EFT35_00305 [Methanophagales archaeon ANME-1-THS]|nr:MAG: hypothetical protein EFT35_00305 [Methanophagales archaeon ANME-1-THS]